MDQRVSMSLSTCKFCDAPLNCRFVDVGLPFIQRQRAAELLNEHEIFSLSHTYVCSLCFLVQMEGPLAPAISEHFYCSSFSPSWLPDLKKYTDQIFARFEAIGDTVVVELASHAQHLQNDQENQPLYFGTGRVREVMDMYGLTDVLICGNELAYAHDINDFIAALKLFLKPLGTITLEFLHLLPIMEGDQFDLPFGSFSYFSFTTVDIIFRRHGLVIYDVEKCSEGILRIFAKHKENTAKRISDRVSSLRGIERDKGISSLTFYDDFKKKANAQGRHFNLQLHDSRQLV